MSRTAHNLANRGEYLNVSECKFCHRDIAWATSKKTGRKYPCEVVPKFDMEGFSTLSLNAEPWNFHNCRKETEERRSEQLEQDHKLAIELNYLHDKRARKEKPVKEEPQKPEPFPGRDIADRAMGYSPKAGANG